MSTYLRARLVSGGTQSIQSHLEVPIPVGFPHVSPSQGKGLCIVATQMWADRGEVDRIHAVLYAAGRGTLITHNAVQVPLIREPIQLQRAPHPSRHSEPQIRSTGLVWLIHKIHRQGLGARERKRPYSASQRQEHVVDARRFRHEEENCNLASLGIRSSTRQLQGSTPLVSGAISRLYISQLLVALLCCPAGDINQVPETTKNKGTEGHSA